MSASQRSTRQREAIRDVLTEADRPLSPREILDRGRKTITNMSLATVYRSLKAFVDEGFLTEVALPGEAARYELAGKGHHHHFHCRDCGRAFDIHGCPGASVDTLAPAGFEVDGHEITLFGRCPACNPAAKKRTKK